MAYQTEKGRRLYAVAGVVALHGVLGYALISGLAVEVVKQFLPPVEARNIDEPVVKTPDVPPPPETKMEKVRVPVEAPVFTIVDETPRIPAMPDKGEIVLKGDGGTGMAPLPQPVPVLRGPAATASVGISEDDYPEASRRLGETGAMTVRLAIGVDGRVTACTVTRSTGHERLDARACQVAQRRWHFTPATADGVPVAGTVVRDISWRLAERR
ncbi:energy transducer TonB [Sandaracinobacteroides saxicola]|uniref:TonB family protein n=1 Tax=Sandaracinobacteroides saxicola TaxID=2759707 RepID=A0A7G5IE98_9SPHN|nr:energy transducer TonB [Sandaracinobacteroides saxicola]QMW21690.1 TonB family protein [Sandaracinobacteroides saxicola]